ncbi:uncharacterized protein LOC133203526 [Saccostrea echinata]|uniref:uncharacterized protein LOC133203526 n=1 Tax=Saccostrea echinata TaxID=191078 RepID=UPI002A804A6F|nr:uncharacterized protein LOC133203526 [Saccostrea echinata]
MEDKKEEIIKCLEKAAELLKGPGRMGSSQPEAAVAPMPPSFRYSQLPVNNHRNQQSDSVPNKEEKKLLFEAGLGEKKITFVKNNNPEEFTNKLEQSYPKLKGCGGYELLRTVTNSRTELELIKPGSNGYTSEYLSNSYLGQATCFIRPIQVDLDISPVGEEHVGKKERCLECGEAVPLIHLRNHILKCKSTEENDAYHNDDDDDDSLPTMQKRKRPKKSHVPSTNRPICEYACASTSNNSHSSRKDSENQDKGTCPICKELFPVDSLQQHAATCGDEEMPGSLKVALTQKRSVFENEDKEVWNIKVLRRNFMKTAIEQLEDADPDDWIKKPKVEFIGEEGIDCGGLFREFFSLLFKDGEEFEGNNFSVNSKLLDQKRYMLAGKAVATSILHGHPGPRRLNKYVVDYILTGKIPNMDNVSTEELNREDFKHAIKQMEEALPDKIERVYEDCITLLENAGYQQRLVYQNKHDAVRALKAHCLLYGKMAAIQQFIEGLKLHGILEILKKFPEDGAKVLSVDNFPTAEEIHSFLKPTFSDKDEEKKKEEAIIYNFSRFLQRVERKKITTTCIDPFAEVPKEEELCLNISHILTCLLGCERIPENIPYIVIEFDHEKCSLPKVNTCLPSVVFADTEKLQNYAYFEEIIISTVVGSYGFGCA